MKNPKYKALYNELLDQYKKQSFMLIDLMGKSNSIIRENQELRDQVDSLQESLTKTTSQLLAAADKAIAGQKQPELPLKNPPAVEFASPADQAVYEKTLPKIEEKIQSLNRLTRKDKIK